MTPERLEYLLDRYRNGILKDPEWDELRLGLIQGGDDTTVRDNIEDVLRYGVDSELWNEERSKEIWAGISRETTPWYTRPLYQVTAVAACLLLAVGTFLLRSSGRRVPGQQTAKVMQPAVKRHNVAMLTLGDGTRIALDSASNGVLAQQGSAKILKAADGRLEYEKGMRADGNVVYNTVETPRGGVYQVTLSDGTEVWLNAVSSIRYPSEFTGDNREVELTGEAYFDVAKGVKPFRVKTSGMEVRVLGTAFNLMAYQDENSVQTTLVSGAVSVTDGKGERKLEPGEQADWKPGAPAPTVSKPDLEGVLGWKDGEFRFRKTNIASIMRQISRWYDVDVRYEGETPDFRFTGIVSRKEYVNQLLDALELTGEIHFKTDGKTITVFKGRQK